MTKRIDRPGIRAGYDRWAETYDATPNPLVTLDRRYVPGLLRPRAGERILDAACGTGAYLGLMVDAGSRPVGLDLSRGMLYVARRRHRGVPLAQADLNADLPLRAGAFDAALCALVGEHVTRLGRLFRELFRSLARGGRLVFSVFHPEMAAAGIEANFVDAGTEYRLGAERHRVDDYLDAIDRAGFRALSVSEVCGDDALVAEVPWASKYVGRPLLLTVEARKH